MKERNLNADLIRCVAVFSVVSVHFLKNCGFYSVPTTGGDMLFMCMFRSVFMICVPLFMILTGYLMWRKTLSRKYYKGIIKTLEIYLLASIACLLFKRFYLSQEVTFFSGLLGILDYDAANYAWYIEMYICLFFMIPFLNLAYHGLKNKKEKQILLLTMAAVTLLPKVINIFDFHTAGWWLSPGSSTTYDPLVPSFFTTMYPITYYFIGAYLREYGPGLNKKKCILFFVLAVAAFGWYNFYRSDGEKFVWGANSTWGGENLLTAVFMFEFLLQLHPEKWPGWIRQGLIFLSQIALGVYLISWIFDQIVYKQFLNPAIPAIRDRFVYYPVVVPVVFLASMGGALLLYLLRDILHKFDKMFHMMYN